MQNKNRRVLRLALFTVLIGAAAILAGRVAVGPPEVSFSQPAGSVTAYDFVEIAATVSYPSARNPFTDATLRGSFQTADGKRRWEVDGFCDSADGSLYRIRFMPPAPGDYRYTLEYRQDGARRMSSGSFQATAGSRRGLIRLDPSNRWHFIWEGNGEHYFFNGTTAYWLIGWQDEKIIQAAIERLHRLKINRLRVTIAGRTNRFYGEPVEPGRNWTTFITPWPATQADDIYHPGFDYTRFDLAYWRRFENALRFARERDVIFSLVLDMNDSRTHPAAGGPDERRLIRYAVARLGAFSNITWDLGDDLDHFRSEQWTHDTGTWIKQLDPYQHLATSHPVDNRHQDRGSAWFDFTSFQEWSREQHAFMLAQRREQERTGRIIPQTNEEYGYEDHYPLWSKGRDAESADTLRRTAWEISMAGGYQTSGETARQGTNIWPDTGGGWMNGRGDDTMTMFQGYAHMVDFFTAFEWWKTDPHDDLVNAGNECVARPGEIYAVYLPHGGAATVRLPSGRYEGVWFNPLTGEKTPATAASGQSWNSSAPSGSHDWALLLQRK